MNTQSVSTKTEGNAINTLLNAVISANSEMKIRMLMKDAGWQSNDSLTDIGWGTKYGYSIWFERWDWHNVDIYSKICFHKHSSDLENTIKTVRGGAILALTAWEKFTDSIPTQLVNEKLGTDTILTSIFKQKKH